MNDHDELMRTMGELCQSMADFEERVVGVKDAVEAVALRYGSRVITLDKSEYTVIEDA